MWSSVIHEAWSHNFLLTPFQLQHFGLARHMAVGSMQIVVCFLEGLRKQGVMV